MPGKKPVINEEMTEEYLTYQREQERSQATLQKYKHDLNALLMEFLKGKELTKTALIDLFVGKVKRIYRCKQKNNCRITDSKVNDICITSKKCQKSRHHKDTTDCQNYTMQTGQCKPVCGCFAGSLSVSGTKTDGNL